MKTRVLITLLASLALLFVMLPAAHADVTMVLVNDPYGQPGPYGLTVNGSLMTLFCDDFVDHIGIGSTWTATVILGSTGDLSTTQMAVRNTWGQTTANTAYDEKAWLEFRITDSNRTLYNEAIWTIFNSSLNFGADQTLILGLIAQANTGGVGLHQYVTVYSPKGAILSGDYKGQTPQEFDTVPDGGMTLMLLGGALVGLETLRRKFRV